MKVFVLLLIFFSLVIPKAVFAHSDATVIRMTADGFEPASVTVDQNQTVIFLNQDNQDHWPASDIHPTHDLYPQFDPQAPIKVGASWFFKPKKAGQWKYHDHLSPHIRGTLIVKEEKATKSNPPNFIQKILAQLNSWIQTFMDKFSASLSGKHKVLESSEFLNLSPKKQYETLKNMAKIKGGLAAWQFLKTTFQGQSGSSGNIHDLAHLAGGLIYDQKKFKGLSDCSPDFSFGCYHGFLDKAFEKSLDQLNEAEEACQTLGEGGPSASCVHGIGHGIASFYQTTDLKAALASCKELTSSGWQYCFDGVFMEFARSASSSFYSKENPYFPCDQFEEDPTADISFACGRNQPTVLMDKFGYSLEEVISICLNSSSEQFKTACFDSVGFITTKSTSNPTQIMATCNKIGVLGYILRCAKAAAGELIFQEVPLWQQNSPAICALLPPNSQADCQNYLDGLIKQYGRKAKLNFRNLSPGEDVNSYLRSQLKICYDTNGRDGCYKQAAQILYSQFGLRKNLDLLAQNENNTEVYARCHEVTHYLSRLEYEKLRSISKVYTQCDSTCHGGCYHGTLEAYLKEQMAQANFDLNQKFPQICGHKSDYQKPIEFNECLHGLGHAAMFITDMELKQSLKLCDGLGEQEFKDRCFTGAFMENSSSSTSSDHASVYIKADDPFYPCNSLEEKYQSVCWQYQSSYFSIISHQDWVRVADLCLQVPQTYQDQCFRTIGTNQVGFTQSLQTMKDDCILMPTDHFKDVCIKGVVSSLSYRFVGDAAKMIEFCSMVDEGYQEGCFKQMGEGLLDWNANKDLAKRNCQTIPNLKQANWCLSVI